MDDVMSKNYNINSSQNSFYYGIYSPMYESVIKGMVCKKVEDAIEAVRKDKTARFKAFQNYTEAREFAENGPSCQYSSTHVPNHEMSSPFRAPKPQDMAKFRKSIENNDTFRVESLVNDNPRYLVSSGDTPSILQEGSRYNALHVAAKTQNASICNFILKTVGSIDFVKKLYGENETTTLHEERCAMLLDLYLNTPDKGFNETPLHFAAKLGHVDVVKILVSYPQCDIRRLNHDKKTAFDIIGTKNSTLSQQGKSEIMNLLEDNFIVAVLRSPDRTVEPILTEPFPANCPPMPQKDKLSPELKIGAFAGPMSPEKALKFSKQWRSLRSSPLTSPTSSSKKSLKSSFNDFEKRLEFFGRHLSIENEVPWSEFWIFLNTFANFQTLSGLDKLENYLENRHMFDSNSSNDVLHTSLFMVSPSALSPTSEFCESFTTKHSCDENGKTPSRNLSYLFLEKTCQVYANKLADCFTFFDCNFIANEIKRIQSLIESCSRDSRYSSIEFSKVHSMIAYMVWNRLSTIQNCDYISVIKRLLLEEKRNKNSVVYCLASKLLDIEQDFERGHYMNGNKYKNCEDSITVWQTLKPCSCIFQIKMSTYREAVQVHVEPDKELFSDAKDTLDSESNFRTDTDSDSENDYFTPPSSPSESTYNLVDNNIFIHGSTPTNVDIAVFDAINQDLIDQNRFPFIHDWLQLMKKYKFVKDDLLQSTFNKHFASNQFQFQKKN